MNTPFIIASFLNLSSNASIIGNGYNNALGKVAVNAMAPLSGVDPSLRVRTDQEIIKRAAALHPGNKTLRKQARAAGIKTIPSPASVRKADAALARSQPFRRPRPKPEQGS